MALDREEIARVFEEGQAAIMRVVICSHQGSSPREAGTAMLVWETGQSGTIGGGALEFEAANSARALLRRAGSAPVTRTERIALGPHLGQCCGGAVTLGFERLTRADWNAIPTEGLHARPLAKDAAAEMPLAIRRAVKSARGEGISRTVFAHGWLAEPVAPPQRQIWIWGAGHVGRAMVNVLRPLPGLQITWIDTTRARFPDDIPADVMPLISDSPADLVPQSPAHAEHLIVTFSHALDLDLCHRLLNHGFTRCGLIGSASKWARFRNRLTGLGHAPHDIARIACPIGDPNLGKHPQAIAISVAASFLSPAIPMPIREEAR